MVCAFDLIKPDHSDQQFYLLRLAAVLAGFLQRGEKQNCVPVVLLTTQTQTLLSKEKQTFYLI